MSTINRKKIEKIISRFILLPLAIAAFLFLNFYPVRVQASAGSGKGIHLAESEEDDDYEFFRANTFPQDNAITEPVFPTPQAPVQSVQNSTTGDISIPWYVTRTSAIISYTLLFLIILLGETMTTGLAYNLITPVQAWVTHKYLGISLGFMLLVHMGSLIVDKFINFSLADILIPLHSNYQPLYLSLGIMGFYIIAAVVFSSLLFRIERPRFWKLIHYAVYPLFLISLVHGIFIGTDTKTLVMQGLYWSTGIIFLILLAHRWRLHMKRI